MGNRIVGDPVCGIVCGLVATEVVELLEPVVMAPLTTPSLVFTVVWVAACPELAEGVGVVFRANNDSKNPFFLVFDPELAEGLGVGVISATFGVGVAFIFLKAISLSDRFIRDPNTNRNTSTTMSPRMKEVALLKPLMRVL